MVFWTLIRRADVAYYETLFIKMEDKILIPPFPNPVDNYSHLSYFQAKDILAHRLYEKR